MSNLPALLRAAERRVNAHVFRTGGDDSLASIPANLDRDVDLLLMEAAEEIERLRTALTAIGHEVRGLNEAEKKHYLLAVLGRVRACASHALRSPADVPAEPQCDHEGLKLVNADGFCLVCGENVLGLP